MIGVYDSSVPKPRSFPIILSNICMTYIINNNYPTLSISYAGINLLSGYKILESSLLNAGVTHCIPNF